LFTYDTNILIYSIDSRNLDKHAVADRVVKRTTLLGLPVPLQCVSEFYRATTKKRIVTMMEASRTARATLRANVIVPLNEDDVISAMELYEQTGAQFFDCVLLTTARRAGCTTLFSEDFQHGRDYGGITVRNPFVMDEAELNALLA
jgi:predicted nucleic acid-binding protein